MSYFIWYQAIDICTSEPYNLERIKSNGFISTKLNEITLEKLVPFTVYNITISTVLHENDKQLTINTLETGKKADLKFHQVLKIKTFYLINKSFKWNEQKLESQKLVG